MTQGHQPKPPANWKSNLTGNTTKKHKIKIKFDEKQLNTLTAALANASKCFAEASKALVTILHASEGLKSKHKYDLIPKNSDKNPPNQGSGATRK